MEIKEYLDNSTWKVVEEGDGFKAYEKVFQRPAFLEDEIEVAVQVGISGEVVIIDVLDDEQVAVSLFKGWLKNAAELEDVFGYIKLFEKDVKQD